MESRLTPYETSPIPASGTVLALAPHPDDEVFGCGAALALHVQAGAKVHVAVLTQGDANGEADVRRDESLRAAAELGYGAIDFWGLPDRGILYGEALVTRILEQIERLDVQLVYAPSLWENHPDHRATALAAREAVRRHGDCALMGYEIGAPLRPNRLIDITAVWERKRAAMRCFGSQLASQRYDRQIEALNVYRTYTLLDPRVEAIEAFEFTDAQTLRDRGQSFLESEYARQREGRLMLLPEDAGTVSVLIRSMDRPELERALSSIAVQTWPRIEVVVVNAKGAGHRPLPQWCGPFPLRFVDSERRVPRSEAANRAMHHAQGQALVFLDDDDFFAPDHVHRLASALEARPDAVAAVTGARAIRPDGSLIYEWQGELAPHRLMLFNQMPIMAVLFRREPIQSGAARFDVELDLFEDWDFWIQLSLLGPLVEVPGSSASYVMQPESGSGVNRPDEARRALAPVRAKWRGRWPDAWLDGLRADFDRIAPLQVQVREKSELLAQHQSQVASLAAQLAITQQQCATAQQHNATMDHFRNVAEHQRATAEHDRNLAQQQFATSEHERHLLQQQLQGLTAALSHSQQALHAAQQQGQVANQQLQALLQSRSWRLAAPLRFMGRGLRRLLGR